MTHTVNEDQAFHAKRENYLVHACERTGEDAINSASCDTDLHKRGAGPLCARGRDQMARLPTHFQQQETHGGLGSLVASTLPMPR